MFDPNHHHVLNNHSYKKSIIPPSIPNRHNHEFRAKAISPFRLTTTAVVVEQPTQKKPDATSTVRCSVHRIQSDTNVCGRVVTDYGAQPTTFTSVRLCGHASGMRHPPLRRRAHGRAEIVCDDITHVRTHVLVCSHTSPCIGRSCKPQLRCRCTAFCWTEFSNPVQSRFMQTHI